MRPQRRRYRNAVRPVTAHADALPDDPGLLNAMLIAQRLGSERLRQIILGSRAIASGGAPRACPKISCSWHWRTLSRKRR